MGWRRADLLVVEARAFARDTVAAVRSLALLVLVTSCTEAEPPSGEPPPSWVYAPAYPDWQLGPLKGRFGRGQAPQAVKALGITGDAKVPLRDAIPWAVRGEPARAVVYGLEGIQPAIEVVEIDSGKHLWRHSTACLEPVIGVTAQTIVCGGVKGVRGIGLDGKPKWQSDQPLVVITSSRIVVGKDRDVVVIGADDGKELLRVTLPAGVDRIVASCEAELLAYTGDQLQRIADVKGKQAITWQVPFVRAPQPIAPPTAPVNPPRRLPVRRPGTPAPAPTPVAPKPSTLEIETVECGESILVATRPSEKPQLVPTPRPRTLRAIARTTGKLTGMIEQVRGWWAARDGDQLDVSAAGLVTRWPRDLSAAGEGLALPILGELLDARGARRLVRATPLTAVVLDRTGVIAYVPLASSHAVLGNTAIVASGARRISIPPRPDRVVRIPPRRAGVALAAELRDLPAVAEITGTPIEKPDTGKSGVTGIAIDPREPTAIYTAALETETSAPSPIARADLSTRSWTWQRTDGCGPGRAIGLVLADGIVACATQGLEATIRATGRDGTQTWERTLDRIDAIDAAGSAVLAYHADRLTVLDAQTGSIVGRIASPDGARVRAAAITTPVGTEHQTWLVTYERGRLIARIPNASLVAVWSLAVDGVVASLAASGEGVLVSLDDGDAYRVDLATAAITPLPGLGLVWRAAGELVTGETVGGVMPGIPVGPPPVRVPLRPGQFDPTGRNPEAPDLWIPIPAPPPLGDSWQYTLYERTGALRARNDYGLAAPVSVSPARGPAGSPLVVASGPAQREVLVLDPRTGNPLRRVVLPGQGFVFGTLVDGSPVAGAVLAAPLRIIVF